MKRENKLGLVMGGRKVLRNGLLAALLGVWPGLTRGETAVQDWVQRCNGPGTYYNEHACGVAVDSGNNVIVTGYADYGVYPSDPYYGWVTIKYSSAGVVLWTNRYHAPASVPASPDFSTSDTEPHNSLLRA